MRREFPARPASRGFGSRKRRPKLKSHPKNGRHFNFGGGGGNLPVFALAIANPLARRRAMLVETPVSPRVPRIRFLQTSIKIKMPPKKPGGILILVVGQHPAPNDY